MLCTFTVNSTDNSPTYEHILFLGWNYNFCKSDIGPYKFNVSTCYGFVRQPTYIELSTVVNLT